MTATTTKRMLLTALLALAPVFTACERADDISSVETNAPSYSVNGNNGNANGLNRRAGNAEALRTTLGQTGSASAWVSGGQAHTLSLNGYTLSVPKGANKGLTLYVMSLVPITDAEGNTYQLVRLKAYDNQYNSVTTFRNPLRLTVPFANADPEQLVDANRLRLGYVADGTTSILEVIQVSIDNGNQTITGLISHFSDYTPILD